MNDQERAFKKLSRLKCGALFMEMGTGKTKVALDLIASKAKKIDYILWICPYSLKSEIESELLKWHPEIVLDIVGCESIGSSVRIFSQTLEKVKSHKSFVVVDESLKIKNIWTKRTKRIILLGDYSKYRLILNGTPLSKNVLDLWPQMEFLSHKILNMSYNEFKNTYCEFYVRGKLKGKVIGQYNIPHLTSKIAPYVFDCKLNIDTEQKYRNYYYFVNDLESYEHYKDELIEEYWDEVNSDFNFKAFAIKLQKYYTNQSNRSSLMQNVLKDINDKVIIFVKFIDSIPLSAHKIVGSMNTNERQNEIEAFKQGKFKTLYITYGCGAYGLNLQFCQNIVFAEHSWDYAQRLQAEARIYRMGQGHSVTYHNLYCACVGLEDLIINCLSKKSNLLGEVKNNLSKKSKEEVLKWAKSL